METHRKTVFVVEDEPNNLRILRDILEFEGCDVVSAQSVQESLVKLEQCNHLDLLLVDVHLPDGSGLSLLEAFTLRFPRIRMMVVTAAASAENNVTALSGGARKVICKPFNIKTIRDEIQDTLSS